MSAKLDALREALALSPQNAPLLLVFAQACMEEWSLDEAREAFERLLVLDSANLDAKLGIARVLHLAGSTSEAAVRVESLLNAHPNCAPAHVLFARLELIDGYRESARTHYERALALDPLVKDAGLESELYPSGSKPPSDEPRKVKVGVPSWEESNEENEPDGDAAMDGTIADVERPKRSFADVGGMDSVKEEIRMKIIHPLKNPDLFRAYGKKIGGGVLLYGPPGCGKTLLARATAGEIKASFISIGIHQILNLYMGESEKNLHELFETARRNAPAVLFFDEVDALAADRNDLKRSAGRTLINQFLAEMDGNVGENEGLLILGATNAPWHLDPAFRRPGRFDRILFVPPPDENARRAVIDVLARNKPVSALDTAKLAAKTRDFSGADLKAVFDMTVERAMARAMQEGHVIPLTTNDLLESAKQLRPSTKAWFESAKNYALYSNQGGFYDEVLQYLGIKK
ncbi:MAG TPA: AAA family ATPase [Chthoniobacteraceae bacterium]|nr:AAA family ATPase [Chthoniobacteraceae bacterium]